jgi:predicted RNase H-like nuclease (RuvC/YqgF family)
MSYKLKYGHLFNLGNYEHEEFEIEREFPDEMPATEAMHQLRTEVLALQDESKTLQEKDVQEQHRINVIQDLETRIDNFRGEIERSKMIIEDREQSINKFENRLKEVKEGSPC